MYCIARKWRVFFTNQANKTLNKSTPALPRQSPVNKPCGVTAEELFAKEYMTELRDAAKLLRNTSMSSSNAGTENLISYQQARADALSALSGSERGNGRLLHLHTTST
jgi:hypothetical protein